MTPGRWNGEARRRLRLPGQVTQEGAHGVLVPVRGAPVPEDDPARRSMIQVVGSAWRPKTDGIRWSSARTGS